MSSGGHNETPNQSPKQPSMLVLLAIALPFVLIALLLGMRSSGNSPTNDSPEAVVARIQPVAGHALESAGAAAAQPKTGEEVYTAQCATCHKDGVVGAPKLGDAAAWAPRIKTGYEALVNSALKGKNAMSAQGGGSFSALEVARAVAYMANAGGAKFEAPKAPEAAPAPAAATGAAPAAVAAPAAGAATAAAAPVAAAAAAPVAAAAAAPAAGGNGKALFESVCKTCHEAGGSFPGSPKMGDKAAWAPRIKTGMPAMIASVTTGKGVMPPKGGKADASEADIKAAVEYMVAGSK